MILLDELKPILEPLLSDENAADVIAAIQAVDTHTVDSEVKAAVDAANAEWGKKFKDTFFGKASADDAPDEPDEEPGEEPDAEDVTLDDLIYPDGK